MKLIKIFGKIMGISMTTIGFLVTLGAVCIVLGIKTGAIEVTYDKNTGENT